MTNPQGFPAPDTPFTDSATGRITQPWLQFLISLWDRTGAAPGFIPIPDAVQSSILESQALEDTEAQNQVLRSLAVGSSMVGDQAVKSPVQFPNDKIFGELTQKAPQLYPLEGECCEPKCLPFSMDNIFDDGPSGGGATPPPPTPSPLVLLYDVTLGSNTTTWDITSVMPATYQNFEIELISVKTTVNGSNLLLYTSSDNGSTWLSSYYWTRLFFDSAAGGPTKDQGAAVTTLPIVPDLIASVGVGGRLELWQGAATAPYWLWDFAYWRNNSGAARHARANGSSVQAGPVNAIRFQFSSGDILAGSRIVIYGKAAV